MILKPLFKRKYDIILALNPSFIKKADIIITSLIMAYENEAGNMDTAFNTGNEVDEHKYEQLGRPRPTRERMNMEASDGHKKKSCRRPPWWGWLIIVIGLLILCAVVVSMVISLTSKCN